MSDFKPVTPSSDIDPLNFDFTDRALMAWLQILAKAFVKRDGTSQAPNLKLFYFIATGQADVSRKLHW